MKRIMTLVGSIIGTVFDGIFSLIMLIGITAILDILGSAMGGTFVAVIGLLLLALGVVGLVFNILMITLFTCNHEKYVKKRSIVITAAVMNFVLALFAFITICTTFNGFYFMWFLASVAAGVLIIVDLCMESKRVAQLQPAEQPAANEKPENIDPFEQK